MPRVGLPVGPKRQVECGADVGDLRAVHVLPFPSRRVDLVVVAADGTLIPILRVACSGFICHRLPVV